MKAALVGMHRLSALEADMLKVCCGCRLCKNAEPEKFAGISF